MRKKRHIGKHFDSHYGYGTQKSLIGGFEAQTRKISIENH